jgi:hypothetical protein
MKEVEVNRVCGDPGQAVLGASKATSVVGGEENNHWDGAAEGSGARRWALPVAALG